MPLFLSKTYHNEEAVTVIGIFSSLEGAKSSIEEIYPVEGIEDYIVAEYLMDDTTTERENVWVYDGAWQKL